MNRAERRRQGERAEKAVKKAKTVQSKSFFSEQQTRTIQQAIDLAVEHHTAGRLSQAESMYQQILQSDPNQAIALHLLGVIAHQVGKNDKAVDLITRALAIKPDLAEAHSNLGLALQELGRLEDAVASYHRALDLNPDYTEAHYNLGNAFKVLGELEEAVASYRKALALKSDYAAAHNNLGNALNNLGKLEEAVASYNEAITIMPDLAEAHNNLGNALKDLGKFDEAEASYHKVLAITPNHPNAHSSLLQCVYCLGDRDRFYQELEKTILKDKTNIGVAAISAFASQQLARPNPYPFCKNPFNFVRVYNTLDGIHGSDSFLRHLTEHFKNLDVVWEPEGKSTKGGFQTRTNNLFDKPSGYLAQLDRTLKSKIKTYLREFAAEDCRFITLFPKQLNLSGWFVRLVKGGCQTEHIHPTGWLSGVFYLRTPEAADREEGAIEFGLWGYDYPILNKNYPKKRFYPRNGDMILFPSSLFHRTIPCHSNEERLSIAFDLMPT